MAKKSILYKHHSISACVLLICSHPNKDLKKNNNNYFARTQNMDTDLIDMQSADLLWV